MPNTLPAVILASSIVQLIDFSTNILLEDHTIFPSTDGSIPENPAVLQHIANNLTRLSSQIQRSDPRKLRADSKGAKLGEAARHLLKLGEETNETAKPLIDAILQAQASCLYGDPRWTTTREAVLTMWKEKDVTSMQKKLQVVRKQVDATLLLALRQYIDQSSEKGLLPFSIDGSGAHPRERWQQETLDIIRTNDWKPKNKTHVEEFSEKVNSLILAENEAQFYDDIFANLHFPEQDDRLYSIGAPVKGSFRWMFDARHQKEGSFLDWLGNTSGQNLFWITGKPGSGKSTLMKYLFRNERLFARLENWSGDSPGILTGFFLWNCGTNLQKSPVGLLRSLLYETLQDMIHGPLEEDPVILQKLFSDRWNQFRSYGGGMQSFTFSQLETAFELLVSDASNKFLLMIDGLDELEGTSTELIDLILRTVQRANVKICLSSRDTSIFRTAFNNRPTLTLEEWTRKATLSYVLRTFDENDTMFNMASEESDGTAERAIVNTIVDKSSGVFLWVTLATDFLVQSTSELDDVSLIRMRVDALPSDLEALLSHILDSLEMRDREQSSHLFRLVDAHGYPGLLPLCFANDTDTKSSLTVEVRPLNHSELLPRIESLRNLLKFKCKGFLTMFEAVPPDEASSDAANLTNFKVNYKHRCIRDFMRSKSSQSLTRQAIGFESFNTDEHWANATLWTLKTLPPKEDNMPIWDHVADCVEYALRLEDADKKVRLTYLEEVAHVIRSHKDLPVMDFPRGPAVESFLDLAIWLNLFGYIAIIAKRVERREVRHAFEYRRQMRKRLLFGGEEKCLGGRKMLKEVYMRPAPELDSLLEYYTKVVRIGTPKPSVEIPNWV